MLKKRTKLRGKELPAAKRMLARLSAGADLRRPKVRKIKSRIRHRSYENALKLEICVDRLLNELLET